MPLFKFIALKPSGERYEGKQEAVDKFALFQNIKKDGNTVISAKEEHSGAWMARFKRYSDTFGGVKTRDKILFARNLGTMLQAGLPLSRALSVQSHQAKGKLKMVIETLGTELNRGQTLSDGLKLFPAVFPQLFISMVKAGEESGGISDSLKVVASQMEKTYLLLKKVKGAMIYPAVIICAMVIITILLMIYVVPTLTVTFKELNVNLPMSTRLIIWISDFLKYNITLTFGILIGVAVAGYFVSTLKAVKHVMDYAVLKLPAIGFLVKETNSARTARTLSSLLSSGVDFLVATRITEEVIQNSLYKKVLKEAQEKVEKGDPISAVFLAHDNLYPNFVGEMVALGEETGRLSEMFGNVAEYYENEVEQKTKDLSTIIEPVLMMVIGSGVGFFAVAMLTPMYSLSNAF
ncbi:MAG: type II secretion system F family protein [Candidatus Paceibacterota bacterium]